MTNKVETYTPANTPEPIGPYNHIAKVGRLSGSEVPLALTPPPANYQERMCIRRQGRLLNRLK